MEDVDAAEAADIGRRSGDADPDRRAILSRGVLREEAWRFVELLAMCSLAVAQPVLDLLGRNPEQFTGRPSPVDAFLLALVVVFVPPTVLLAVSLPTRLISERAEHLVHRSLLGVLAGVTLVQLVADIPHRAVAWALGVGAAVGFVVLIGRVAAVRPWLRILALSPVLFVSVFMFASPVSEVLFPGQEASEGAVPVGNPIPVVWIVFDELPTASLLDGEGKIDAELFPNFARLADGATWFRNTSTVSTSTAFAIPAIFTGMYPTKYGTFRGAYPDNVFTALSGTYSMDNVQESFTRLCPTEQCPRFTGQQRSNVLDLAGLAARLWTGRLTGTFEEEPEEGELAAELDEFVEEVDGVALHDPRRLRQWVDQMGTGRSPQLDALHIVLPHYPWRFTPSGYRYVPRGHNATEALGLAWSGPAGAESARLRHLLQLQFVDGWLGAMIDRMQETGLWDEALVVVTADHGVSFQAGQAIRGIDTANAWEVMWVPLFLRGPGFEPGAISDADATTLDILPTVADVLEVRLPWQTDGVSLIRSTVPEQPDRYVKANKFSRIEADETGYITIDARTEFPKVLRAARKGEGDDDLRLWRSGEYAALVGQPLSALTLTETAGDPAVITSLAPPVVFDAGSLDAPVSLVGKVPQLRTDGTNVAIALNGTIVAVRPFTSVNRAFSVVLPDTRMVDGENDLRLFVLSGPPGAPRAIELTWIAG